MLHKKGERRIKKNREQEFKALMKRSHSYPKGDWTNIYEWVKFLILSTVEGGRNYRVSKASPLPKEE